MNNSFLNVEVRGLIFDFPNLRFPGFEGEWKINRLKDVVKNISSGKSKNGTSQGEYPFFGSTGIISYSNQPDYSGEKILIARVGANAGFIYKVKGSYAVSDNALVLDINNEKSLDFIFYYLSNFNLNKLIFGSGQPLITGGQLKSIEIALPSIEEQNKVSTFLSFIEDRIQTQKKIIEDTILMKNSISKKIFSRKLNLADENRNKFPKWQQKTLAEVLSEPIQKPERNSNEIELLTVRLYCKGVENTGNYPAITKNGRPYYRRFTNEILIGRQNFHNGGIGIVQEKTMEKYVQMQ